MKHTPSSATPTSTVPPRSSDGRAQWSGWAEPLPFPWLERFFVLLRLSILLLMSVALLRFRPVRAMLLEGESTWLVSPLVVLPAFVLYEVVAGFYVWRKRPLASGGAVGFLVINLAFAALFYGVTGGIGSVYYYPFAMVTAYAALALKAVPAAIFILSATALHTVVGALFVPRAQWNAEIVGVAVGESVVLLALGGVVLYFTGMVRRDAQAHDAARAEAQRRALLNEMALRLAEHGLDLARVGQTIVEAALRLAQTEYVLLLWRGNGDQQPHVVSSTSARHSEGEHLAGLEWPTALRRVIGMGAGYATSLPPAFAREPVRQLILASAALPDGATPGAICFARQADQPLSPDELTYVQELTAEAGLAVRNARLYAREVEQVERLHRFQTVQATYFAAVAHEMKTPLTVLRTLAPSLRRLPELPDATRREILDAMDGNLARLEWSINGPLKAARLEAGVIVLRPRPLELVGYIEQMVDRLSPWLHLKRQQVLITAARDLPRVRADGRQIDHIIGNLLVNAIKYGPDDGTIRVDLQPAGELMQVSVADEGPGVPPEQRERIFEKFHSADAAHATGGAGLGLYICRELVHLHGGRIWVEERPAGGSRFCFTLPLASVVSSVVSSEEGSEDESQPDNPGD